MANIYGMVRLLPPSHPYLDARNMGKFGIRHVIGEAANNLVFKKQNIDQIIIFGATLSGIVILAMQFALLAYAYIIKPAFATSVFVTDNVDFDIAYMLMDYVFGIPNVFESCVASGVACPNQGAAPDPAFPTPFHFALQSMFRFYSLGMLMIAMLIFLYFVVVVVAETATTGHAFGHRFQNVWVPIRIVVALGLLVPINFGMNSGQYITLYSAKFGSSFATNAWLQFNDSIQAHGFFGGAGTGANPSGERESLVARPNDPDITPVIHFMSLAHACAYGYWKAEPWGPPPFPSGPPLAMPDPPPAANFNIKPYLVKQHFPWMPPTGLAAPNDDTRMEVLPDTEYLEALDFFNNGNIIIRFGRHHDTLYASEKGHVTPLCGEITVNITDLAYRGQAAAVGGADQMQQFYFNLIKGMWFGNLAAPGGGGAGPPPPAPGSRLSQLAHRYMEYRMPEPNPCSIAGPDLPATAGTPPPCATELPGANAKQRLIETYQWRLNAEIIAAHNTFDSHTASKEMTDAIRERGWAGAGIWYNTISQINGAFIGSVITTPTVSQYPKVMEKAREEQRRNNIDLSTKTVFCPETAIPGAVEIFGTENTIAGAMCDFDLYWTRDDANHANQEKYLPGNFTEGVMNLLFGTNGLMEIRGNNAHLHPLAQLSAVGKGLVNSAIFNIGASTALAVGAGPVQLIERLAGTAAEMASEILMTTAFVGLTAGFVLFYVLPFLPFLYFFFAVASWVKTIFEAMVGVPLWALAHLRLDGEGLPGDSASSGYFLIFEIFTRPILSIFGLAASVVIFTAQVRVLNFIWDLVVNNVTGHNTLPVVSAPAIASIPTGGIDQFCYTIIYTILVYMLATSSFKLIDKIPDNILRWAGAGVSSFSDINQDPTDSLTRYAALGGLTIGQQATQGLQKFASQTGHAFGDEMKKLGDIGGLLGRGTGPRG